MSKKQAVLLIHGIGEQKPMDTLRGFVNAVWTTDTAIHHEHAGNSIWSKPDNVSRSYELRRLTTSQNQAGIRTDFFEFYWAHLMKGTSYGHVLAWTLTLLLRRPDTVPRHLKAMYWILVLMLFVAVALALLAALDHAVGVSPIPPWLSMIGSFALFPLASFIVLRVVGDAARYLHAAPTNIQRRHEIRQAGVALIKELHDRARDYDRIVIVGHSLGSVIGYDILTHCWVDFHQKCNPDAEKMEALDAIEALAQSETSTPEIVQSAQRRYLEEIRANGSDWRVTDFVTLGSPLAHAAILLANDADDLKRKQADREFPRCLPAVEAAKIDHKVVLRFSYEAGKGKKGYRVPHHAAVFGPTRWTNLYFPCRAIIFGDLVGGVLRGLMGNSIRDVVVSTKRQFGLLTHTLYWSQKSRGGNETHIGSLREALDLCDLRK